LAKEYLISVTVGFFIMRILLFSLIGALSIIMTSSANASGTLVLETSKGEIRIALLETLAPNHVTRIKELAQDSFYDGVVFHRVIKGFMAQTGDPTGTGTGGSGKNLEAEFSDYTYRYGTVGMARANNPNSADSQFFICFDGCEFLTGQYTVWGQVESGMEAVEAINVGEPPAKPDKIIKARIEN
jgi:peptidylprolyl isomerase